MKTKTIIDNVYRVKILFIVERDSEKAKQWLIKNYAQDVSKLSFNKSVGAKMLWDEDDHTRFAIWLRNEKDKSFLVHELVHLAHRILSQRGLKLENDSEEAYAYYVGYLFNSCTK